MDLIEQRGRACARFINATIEDIAKHEGFSGPGRIPWDEPIDSWDLMLHARGIKSRIRLFTEPNRFKEAQSPFQIIAPAPPFLDSLYKVFADPEHELDEFHRKIPIWEGYEEVLGKELEAITSTQAFSTPKDPSVAALLKQTEEKAINDYTRTRGQLMYMRGVLKKNGVVYTLAWHWIQHGNQIQLEQAQSAKIESAIASAFREINAFLREDGKLAAQNALEHLNERLKETTGADGQPDPTRYFNSAFHRLLEAGREKRPSDPLWIFDSSIEYELTYYPDHFAPIYGATAGMLEPGKRPAWLTFEMLWKFQWKMLGALKEWLQKAPNPILAAAIKEIEAARKEHAQEIREIMGDKTQSAPALAPTPEPTVLEACDAPAETKAENALDARTGSGGDGSSQAAVSQLEGLRRGEAGDDFAVEPVIPQSPPPTAGNGYDEGASQRKKPGRKPKDDKFARLMECFADGHEPTRAEWKTRFKYKNSDCLIKSFRQMCEARGMICPL